MRNASRMDDHHQIRFALPESSVHPHHGVPTLFINGQPHSGMAFMTYNQKTTRYFGDFGHVGVSLATFGASLGWTGPVQYDYAVLDHYMHSLLKDNPNAWIMPRVGLFTPRWWSEAHPEELVRQDDGTVWNPEKPEAAWASEVWRRDVGAALAAFIHHIRASDYGHRVIGYHLASGTTEEWYWWGYWDGACVDYSEPNRRAYAAFLRRLYKTEDALRQAWDEPKATFAQVTPPTRQERQTGDDGLFRRGGHGRRVADFERYHSELIAETLGLMAAVAKRETDEKQICGGFYGYVTDLFVTSRCGHWALGRLLENPAIDFLTAPSSYGARELGSGYNGFMTALESVRLHGKLWFDENDYRTFLTPKDSGYGRTDTREQTIAVQERELAQVLSQGSGMWWFDMVSGWFDDPQLMAAIARLNGIAEKAVTWDRESVAEVAVVLDEESIPFIHIRQNVGRALVTQQQVELGHMGAPFDTILLSDLERARPYKLYIFPNAWNVTDERRAIIDGVVKTGGRTALWLYAPGYAGADDWPERMHALTGLTFRTRPSTGSPVTVETLAAADGGLPGCIAWSLGELNPLVSVCDPAAAVLGHIKETGEPGLALRRFTDWTSLHASAGPVPAAVLRALARQAGVHIYCEQDASLYVNRSFIALHSREAGVYTLRLPAAESRVDLLSGQEAGSDQLWSEEYPAATTRLWFRGKIRE